MRDITRRLCLVFLLFSLCFSAAIDSSSQSKLGEDGHGLPPQNLHQEDANELFDPTLPVPKSDSQKIDDIPTKESINSEKEQSESESDSPADDKLDEDVLPQSPENDKEISTESVNATEKTNMNELSTVPGDEENIRDENSNNDDTSQDANLAKDNSEDKDIVDVPDKTDSDKPETGDNENPEDHEKTAGESKTAEDSKNLDKAKDIDDEKVSENEKQSEGKTDTEGNADSEENLESEVLDDETENVFEADETDEYDPNEELSENQYVESQDEFVEEEKDEEEVTSENLEIVTDRFGREMGRESSPTQKFFGVSSTVHFINVLFFKQFPHRYSFKLVAIIVMAMMLVYFLKFQSPRLEKDETRYQPLNDVEDSPEHVRMSLINGATDDADEDDEEDEVWKWS